jgi:hypothetical protein
VLVGPSGARKGTAMDPGYVLLNDIGIRMSFESTTREALIRSLARSTNTTVSEDGTITMHSSLTVYSQELTVFLGYNNLQLMTDLCDWYDCKKRWTYDTKGQGRDEIHGVFFNLIGATTPDLLQSALPRDAVGSGLSARMVLVYESKKGKVVYFPFLTEEQRKLGDKLREDLEQIAIIQGEYKITDRFIDYYINWRDRHEVKPPMMHDSRFAGYIERRPAHLLKLGMILAASRSDNMVIDMEDLERAEQILVATERRMPKAFAGVGKNIHGDILNKLWLAIKMHKKMKFSDVMAMFHFDCSLDEINGVVDTIRTMKVIQHGNDGGVTVLLYIENKELEEQYGIIT